MQEAVSMMCGCVIKLCWLFVLAGRNIGRSQQMSWNVHMYKSSVTHTQNTLVILLWNGIVICNMILFQNQYGSSSVCCMSSSLHVLWTNVVTCMFMYWIYWTATQEIKVGIKGLN